MQEKKFFNKLYISFVEPDSSDTLARLLQAWRLWVVSAVIGAVLGGVLYSIFPPQYQAQATVIVDHNSSEVWYPAPDRYIWNFLTPEVVKLRDIVWADETLQAVVDQIDGLTIEELRTEKLQLSYINDGPWHFVAQDDDPERAQQIAAAWANAFIDLVRSQMTVVGELEALRAEMIALYTTDTYPAEIEEQADVLAEKIIRLEKESLGVSPYLDLYLTEEGSLLAERVTSRGVYILSGSVVGFVLVFFYVLIFDRKIRK